MSTEELPTVELHRREQYSFVLASGNRWYITRKEIEKMSARDLIDWIEDRDYADLQQRESKAFMESIQEKKEKKEKR